MSNYIFGTINCQTNLAGLNTPAQPNRDSGLILQIHPDNIIDPNFTNTLTAATILTATISEAVERGWVIEITTGAAAGDKRRITAVGGLTVTIDTAWSAVPAPGDSYNLYKRTHFALIWRPTTQEFLIGYTHNDALVDTVDLEVIPIGGGSSKTTIDLGSDYRVNNVIPVTIHSFAWNTAVFSGLMGSVAIYVETTGSVTLQLMNGLTPIGSITAMSTGHYVMAVTMPVVNSLLEFQVLGRGVLRSAVLAF
jgi:hypothetical protein